MSKRAIEVGRTIYNLSTGNLYNQSSGVSINRISGPNAFSIASKKQGNEIILSAIKKNGTLSMKAKAVY